MQINHQSVTKMAVATPLSPTGVRGLRGMSAGGMPWQRSKCPTPGRRWACGPRRASGQRVRSGETLQRVTSAQIHA